MAKRRPGWATGLSARMMIVLSLLRLVAGLNWTRSYGLELTHPKAGPASAGLRQ